jgi:hypothetical protein
MSEVLEWRPISIVVALASVCLLPVNQRRFVASIVALDRCAATTPPVFLPHWQDAFRICMAKVDFYDQ